MLPLIVRQQYRQMIQLGHRSTDSSCGFIRLPHRRNSTPWVLHLWLEKSKYAHVGSTPACDVPVKYPWPLVSHTSGGHSSYFDKFLNLWDSHRNRHFYPAIQRNVNLLSIGKVPNFGTLCCDRERNKQCRSSVSVLTYQMTQSAFRLTVP